MKHGLPAFNLKNADVVILGTFPGELSLCKKEYYANNSNHFWCLLGLDKHIKNARYNDLRLLKGKQIWFNGKEAYKHFIKAQKQQNLDFKVNEKHILPSSSPSAHVDFETKKKKWCKIKKQ